MRTVLNIIWLVFAGLWLALGYAIAGVIMFVLIITIPFGRQAFKLAGYSLWPFGRTVVRDVDAGGASVLGNILWFLLAGWWLALMHLVSAFLLAITVIGFPLAIGNLKLIPAALTPFGREIMRAEDVSTALASYRGQQGELDRHRTELEHERAQLERERADLEKRRTALDEGAIPPPLPPADSDPQQ
jgi:uncharacterized membrane protein YccF (DUF307 family)